MWREAAGGAMDGIEGTVRLYLYSPTEEPGFNVPVPSLKSLQMQLFALSRHAGWTGLDLGGGYDPYGPLVRRACEAALESGDIAWDGRGPSPSRAPRSGRPGPRGMPPAGN